MSSKKNSNSIPESDLNKVAAGVESDNIPETETKDKKEPGSQALLPENSLGEVHGGINSSGGGSSSSEPAGTVDPAAPRPMPLYGVRPPIMVKYGVPRPDSGKDKDKDKDKSGENNPGDAIKPIDPQ